MQKTVPTNNRFPFGQRDTVESGVDNTLGGFGTSLVKNAVQSFADIGGGMVDQLAGNFPESENPYGEHTPKRQEAPKNAQQENKTLFNFREQEENRLMQELKELIKQIKKEVEMIKHQDKALLADVKDIEKLSIDSSPSRLGVYDISFMEIVLKMLQALRSQLSESRTWMQALMSKKKKRGSAFASRSKSQGTAYSMSQELQASRNVQ